jgi:GTP cyclohydrolase II
MKKMNFERVDKRLLEETGWEGQYRRLFENVAEDMEFLGIPNEYLTSIKVVNHEGVLLPGGVAFRLKNGPMRLTGFLGYEVHYAENNNGCMGREWDGRVFVFPHSATLNGKAVRIPQMYLDDGYQALIYRKNRNGIPLVRVDSACKTSMVDGHYSSGGDHALGCDCDRQRALAKDFIHKDQIGGISLLTPAEGRANGLPVHAGQIMMQNFAVRHGLSMPGTYKAHELLGHPHDNRGHLYLIDAAVLQLLGCSSIRLLTNNPEKVGTLESFGVHAAEVVHIVDPAMTGYYNGHNFQAKMQQGGHCIGPFSDNGHTQEFDYQI